MLYPFSPTSLLERDPIFPSFGQENRRLSEERVLNRDQGLFLTSQWINTGETCAKKMRRVNH